MGKKALFAAALALSVATFCAAFADTSLALAFVSLIDATDALSAACLADWEASEADSTAASFASLV